MNVRKISLKIPKGYPITVISTDNTMKCRVRTKLDINVLLSKEICFYCQVIDIAFQIIDPTVISPLHLKKNVYPADILYQ
jgi:hypothetical protein